ncbi:MAG: DUF2239 family protein [Gemmatimonadaceae bacterium]
MIGTTSMPATAFEGSTRIASGALRDVAVAVKAVNDRGTTQPVLIFDDVTSHPIELDLRGTLAEVLARLAPDDAVEAPPAAPQPELPRGPGRPKLGVVPREITLLPRHWEWLGKQPGGASVALRKLVEEAKKQNEAKDRARTAQESAYRFMSTLAGNQPGFEEATRAFFANNAERFEQLTQYWPPDVREHALVLASRAFGAMRYKVV